MKIPFFLEKKINKIIKPQLVTIIETKIDGKLKKRFFGKSLTANFLQHLYANYNQNNANFADPPAFFLNKVNVKTITNGNLACNNLFPRIDAPAGSLISGIILGTGTTAPTPTDISIQTVIAHGSGTGQLNYGAQQGIMGTTITGSLSEFTINRTFNNNSGGTITVNECAVYVNIQNAGSVCVYRDLISPADTVNNGQVYDVLITYQITT